MSDPSPSQTMWGFQHHFRISLDSAADRALDQIGAILSPDAFLVGFPSDGVDPAEVRLEAREGLARRFTDAFVSAWTGTSESDRFDRLVLQAGLTWRQVVVLRTYCRYLRQTGTTFSEEYMAGVLGSNPEVARLLVAVFETRFAPDRFAQAEGQHPSPARLGAGERAVAAVTRALEVVENLTQDRILRWVQPMARSVPASLRRLRT